MNQLISFLMQNPILLVVIVIWLFSGLASTVAKAAKRAQQQQQQQQRRRPDMEALAERRHASETQHQQAPVQGRTPVPQNADEIARQLREMLGLETVAPPPRSMERSRRASATSDDDDDRVYPSEDADAEPDAGDEEFVRGQGAHVGALHQEVEHRRVVPTAVSQSVAQHLGHTPTKAAVVRHAPTRRSFFDARAAAQAVVALEVLGPPRAERPYGTP